MGFLYTRPRHAQHLLLGSVLAAAIGLGQTAWLQQHWASWVSSTSDTALFVLGSWGLHLIIFWPVSLGFLYVDHHDTPTWIARYRIQDGPRRQPPLGKTLRVLALNQLVLTPVLLFLLVQWLRYRGWAVSETLPSVGTVLLELSLLTVTATLVFYVTHRFLHRPWWMKRVHRVHHEFRTTTAMASEYAHPVEFTTGNFATLAAGVALFQPSLPSIFLFETLALLHILVHHCGYALPWAPWPMPHDWHHYRYKELFGTIGLMDRALGTDQEFKTLEHGDRR